MPIRRRGQLWRQHPDRRVELPEDQTNQGPASFEALVEEALDSLPEMFQRLLNDVAIVIEDLPTPEQAGLVLPSGAPVHSTSPGTSSAGAAPGSAWLYGLYEGVPGIEWGADMAPFPNKITLFQVPLETDFPDPDRLADEVRRTVIHELAHHAGISDERLHELDYD